MRWNKGFSLIELLITLSLVAIIATAATTGLSRLYLAILHRSATSNIEHFLNLSRQSAIHLAKPVRVFFQTQPWCIGATTANSCNCNKALDCLINGKPFSLQQNIHPSITVSNVAFGSNTYTGFDPMLGTAFGNNGSFSLSSAVGETRIIISALGRTRFCKVKGNFVGIKSC